ncbi:MAG: Putative RNA methyltransferase [Mitsuokella multacida]|jgi:RNA methyltransferase, TrmH family
MPEIIDSAANKKIKLMQSLNSRRHRTKEGLFRVEGLRLAEMAAASNWTLRFALYTAELAEKERGRKLLAALQEKCPAYEISAALAKKVAATDTPQGVFLVAEQRERSLQELAAKKWQEALYVVLDGVQDPGNAGTIIRTADAVHADGVILTKGAVDVFGDKTVRATMGSLFHLPIVTGVTASELAAFAETQGCQLLATALDETAKPHFEVDFTKASMLVFGNEGNGVSRDLLNEAVKVYIPMYGQAESLNVGVSAAIVLYEAVRQRHFA